MDRGNINVLSTTHEEPEAQECQIIFLNTMCVHIRRCSYE